MLATAVLALLSAPAQEEAPPLDPKRVAVDADSWINICAQLNYLALMRIEAESAGGVMLTFTDEELARVEAWLAEHGPERLKEEFRALTSEGSQSLHPVGSMFLGHRGGPPELYPLEGHDLTTVWVPLRVPSWMEQDEDMRRGLEMRYASRDGEWELDAVPRVANTMEWDDLPTCEARWFESDPLDGTLLRLRHFRAARIPAGVYAWYAGRDTSIPEAETWFDILDADYRLLDPSGPFPVAAHYELSVSGSLPAARLVELLRTLAKDRPVRVSVDLAYMELSAYFPRRKADEGTAVEPRPPPRPDADPVPLDAPGARILRYPAQVRIHLPWGYEDQESARKVVAGTTREALGVLFPRGVPERVSIVCHRDATVQDIATTAVALLGAGVEEVNLPVFEQGEEPTGPRVDPDDDF